MEVVEDPLVKTPVDAVDNVMTCRESYENSTASVETDKCHKSNGDAKSEDAEETKISLSEEVNTDNVISEIENLVCDKSEEKTLPEDKVVVVPSDNQEILVQHEIVETCPNVQITVIEEKPNENLGTEIKKPESKNFDTESSTEKNTLIEKVTEIVEPIISSKDTLDCTNDKVTFETEILVESNDSELLESKIKHEPNPTSNILTELGQSIELSEALRASDVIDATKENNNCTIGSQEMFNKEELLDILEGNDENEEEIIAIITNDTTKQTTIIHSTNPKKREAEIAMDQLTRLKNKAKTPRRRRMSKKQREDIVVEKVITAQGQIISEKLTVVDGTANDEQVIVSEEVMVAEEVTVAEEVKGVEITKEGCLVSDLVKDWEEDDQLENVSINQTQQNVSQNKINDDSTISQEEIKKECDSQESPSNDQGVAYKNKDEGLPQRRLGRVIKKKVIFDPDNPDTFTKTKVTKAKENQIEKEQPPIKKTKVELSTQIQQRSNSKSPISKLQWKKPTTKHSNKIKRPSEIDKLLMDEGALNMIYQLTPEAPKGKKNMKTKAEFIKKIQSSTPDSKEMKFRERKKDAKYEEGDAKKILSGKQRVSLSSSVKSPSVSEDFEAHSADDSIIYRRHSSSSYSSSCMSPRRLSDVEGTVGPTSSQPSLGEDLSENQFINNTEIGSEGSAAFMGSNASVGDSTEVINKHDCLSIKKKLNSKLALALNKRKRESGKADKPLKTKKVVKIEEKSPNVDEDIKAYKHLTINLTDRLGEIIIRKSGSKYNLEVISELIKALHFLESIEDISVILLVSECGTLCSGLELNPLLNENNEVKVKYAQELAESVRSLLCLLEQQSKLVCTGIEGACWGISLALVALSDVCVASEKAIFQLGSWGSQTEAKMAPLVPGLAVFTANHQPWPRTLLNDLTIFGRQLSAAEALQYGLVSRNIWPERFLEQLHGISKDIASLPVQAVLLKKKLLKINNGSQPTFLNCLEKERDLFVKYWLSAEGQESLRAYIGNS